MWFSDQIELGTVTETVTYGESIKSYTWKSVLSDKQSPTSKEFYSGESIGMKPELKFVVNTSEYANEDVIRYGSVIYYIFRKYEKGDFTELYVTKTVE